MSKKNKKKPAQSPAPITGQPAETREVRRPKYYKRATILHIFTFITCFTLFVFFSIKIANQPLNEMQPATCTGWYYDGNPETGQQEKVEFSATPAAAMELAQLLDSTPSQFSWGKTQIYGEINFTFARNKRTRQFSIASNGVIDSQGLFRLKDIPIDQVKEIVRKK
ncbi:MAG: hypothetical protein K6C40_12310 [Thermoguttaceae bacterium]|nr:hypothetical protein [Thermoguttaceae bacterium]